MGAEAVTARTAYPPGTPTWMRQTLDTMSQHGKLTGVNPAFLATIALAESGYEAKGAGVNRTGYGGFFGLGAGKVYPAGESLTNPGSVRAPSAGVLDTPGSASLRAQAPVAAQFFAHLITANNGTVVAAVNQYVTGHASGNATASGDAKDVLRYVLGGTTKTSGRKVLSRVGWTTKTSGVPASHTTTTTPPTTSLSNYIPNPLSGIAGAVTKLTDLTYWKRVAIFLGGAAMVGAGIFLLAQGSKGIRSAEGLAALA